jgi:hypothetical protein
MKLVTKRDLIQNIVRSWEAQFGVDPEKPRLRAILEKLRELDLSTATEDDIEAIIGNRTWTQLQCVECKHETDEAVQFGAESDTDGQPFYLCPDCLKAASSDLPQGFNADHRGWLSVA